MIAWRLTRRSDRVGWETASWWLFLTCIATSFLVMVEPAPTDLFFVLCLLPLVLAGFRAGAVIGPIEMIGVILFLWFSIFSMLFVIHEPGVATRALGIEIYMILLFLVTAYFARHYGDRAFQTIMLIWLASAIAAAGIGILAWFDLLPNSGQYFLDEYRVRMRSTFKDPNVLGPFLIPPALLCIYKVVSGGRGRLPAAGAGVLILTVIVITFSRGAWIHTGLSLAIFAAALMIHPPTARTCLFGLIAAVAVALALILFYGNEVSATLQSGYFGQRLSLQSYDDDRFAEVAQGAQLIGRHPFGIGPNQAPAVYGILPHNTFVVLGLHNGFLAAVGFSILFFGAILRCLDRVLRRRDGWLKYAFILAAMAGLFVLMNVVGALHWRHLFVLIGLAHGEYRSSGLLNAGPPTHAADPGHALDQSAIRGA